VPEDQCLATPILRIVYKRRELGLGGGKRGFSHMTNMTISTTIAQRPTATIVDVVVTRLARATVPNLRLQPACRASPFSIRPRDLYGDAWRTHSTRRTSVDRRSGDRLVPVAKSK